MPFVSFIIPTLNEGKWLERTLRAIDSQSVKDFELLIVDSGSKDNTLEIAKKYGAIIVPDKKLGPGHGRNIGAKQAKGEVLAFIDADTLVQSNLVDKLKAAFSDKKVVATVCWYHYIDGYPWDALFWDGTSLITLVWSYFNPIWYPGFASFFRKSAFDKAGGYDLNMQLCEDHDMGRRVRKYGKVRFMWGTAVWNSARRLYDAGYFKSLKANIVSSWYYLTNKKVAKKSGSYDFGKH